MPSSKDEIYIPSLAFFFASIGLILSLVANFYCGYATTNLMITENVDDNNITTSSSTPFTWRAGIWNYEDHDIYYVVGSREIYFVRYFYCVPWKARTQVDHDGNWTASQVFSVISVVLGGSITVMTCCFMCSDIATMSRVTCFNLGIMYLVILICQGFTFLYFPSNACHNGLANASYGSQDFELQWDGCTRSSGANCSIASMVFYFVSSMILFSAVSITASSSGQLSGGRGQQVRRSGDEDHEAQVDEQ